ncbi:PadR family transcriptional regulator [Nonomuraea rubra]|uniref:DNA-binding PadR family transcriptional regulator n=1 Tax=Nonomuraea rubra TaxID=46180 RepID=A0A7X0P8J5_9ACTN|nr:helix-turn-helix transcriptional regulator [Nonomuraea rubra]MBB6557277.1 DNA-binding PadR family transcriptional regulator [Nonomuraea rubra]
MYEQSRPRMTLPTQLVLRALLEDPTQEMYGLEICAAASLPTGTIHPILARFEGLGWLESRWEETDPHQQGRPRRRYYRLTRDGIEQARQSLAHAEAKRSRLSGLSRGLSGGTA